MRAPDQGVVQLVDQLQLQGALCNQFLQVLVVLAQLLLCLHSPGDVPQRGQQGRLPVPRYLLGAHLGHHRVSTRAWHLDLHAFAGHRRKAERCPHQVLGCLAEQRPGGRVGKAYHPLGVQHQHGVHVVLDDGAQPRLAVAQALVKLLPLQRVEDGARQQVGIELTFHQVVLRALLQGLQPQGFVLADGENHHRHVRCLPVQRSEALQSVAIRQGEVQQDQVHLAGSKALQPAGQAVGHLQADAHAPCFGQHFPDQPRVAGVVLDQENADYGRWTSDDGCRDTSHFRLWMSRCGWRDAAHRRSWIAGGSASLTTSFGFATHLFCLPLQ